MGNWKLGGALIGFELSALVGSCGAVQGARAVMITIARTITIPTITIQPEGPFLAKEVNEGTMRAMILRLIRVLLVSFSS